MPHNNGDDIEQFVDNLLFAYQKWSVEFFSDKKFPSAERLNHDEARKQLINRFAQVERAARLSERKEIALDNYQGQTFSDSTNWHGKFDKFVENNEKRITILTEQSNEGENDE